MPLHGSAVLTGWFRRHSARAGVGLWAILLFGMSCGSRCLAQNLTIESIDLYGLGSVSEPSVRAVLPCKAGEPLLDPEKLSGEIIRRVKALPGVQTGHVEFVQAHPNTVLIYIGLETKGAGSGLLRFRKPPHGADQLLPEMVQAGKDFETRLMEALQHNDMQEDDSQGIALMHYPPSREVQERFLRFVSQAPDLLQKVLLNSADDSQRALAGQIIGYASDRQKAVDALVRATTDPNQDVRNNAIRALGCLASYAQITPRPNFRIPYPPLVNLLNSPIWSDRNKAIFVLFPLTSHRDHQLLGLLRKQALPALAEMAHWHEPGHSQGAFIVLGRIGGLSEEAIQVAWNNHNVNVVLQAAQGSFAVNPYPL